MSTKLYALRSKDKPDWMTIAPIEPLTETQWKVIPIIAENVMGKRNYITANSVGILAGISESTARKALNKLVDMGLLRKLSYGGYARRVWYP